MEKTTEFRKTNTSTAENACEFLNELFSKMNMNSLTTDIIFERPDCCEIKIDGEDVSYILGWHGEILDSLQYLTCLISGKSPDNEFCKIRLEASDYRENRKNTLISLGKNKALQAIKFNRCIRLEPMKSYERKIIHTAVNEVSGAYSWSEGKEKLRYVVIAPTYE